MGVSLPQAPPSEAQRRPEVGSLASWRRPSPTLGTVSSNQKQPGEDETLDSMAARAPHPDFASQPHQGGSFHDRGPSRSLKSRSPRAQGVRLAVWHVLCEGSRLQ